MTKLTPIEQRILEDKATEQPFSGRFLYLQDEGVFCCRRCSAPLYRSDSKFESGCGWPAFDDEVTGAIERRTDADGRRTEILCGQCGGHLGHVFEGERLTPNNVRHCVNGNALSFTPNNEQSQQVAVFGGGCFWCLEALFQRVKGVSEVISGYCGGDATSANYQQVCSGNSGHIEVIQLKFDPQVVSFGQLLELFFDCHDPTSWDRQGADKGSQYRSAIFVQNPAQQQQAERQIALRQQHSHDDIVTQLLPSAPFYAAESGHQNYFNSHTEQPYCQWNIVPKLEQLQQKYADRFD